MARGARAAEAAGDPLLGLTDKQQAFLHNLVQGLPQTTAARTAGYAVPTVDASRQLSNPRMQEALRYLHHQHQQASKMTRKKVMDGMLEAIEMAKVQGESGVMVAGWREIGRMCGYYAAEKKVIDVNISAKRAVDKLEMLSDAELLELVDEDSAAIEGEFAEILEDTQTAADAEHEGWDEDDDK